MSKKYTSTIVPLIVISTLIVILLFYFTVRKPSKPSEPLKAIPVSASVIVKINDFRSLYRKAANDNAIWANLKNIPLFDRVDRQLQFIDSLIRSVPEVELLFDNPPFFISAHLTGKDKISLMHVLQLPSRVNEKKIRDLISGFVVNAGTIKVRNYEGISLHEVALLDESVIRNFYFAFYRDIFMISFSTTVLEDAIRQLINNESLLSVSGFERIYATAGKNVDANIFINFLQFPKSLSAFVKADFKSEVRSFRNFAGWAELDLNTFSDMLLMNGFVNPSDSLTCMASLFLQQPPQRITADEILPSSTGSFLSMNISDPEAYIKGYDAFLSEQGRLTGYNNTLLSLQKAYGTDFREMFFEIMDKEITLGFEGNSPEGSMPGIYLLMRIKSKAQTEEKLKSMLAKIAAVEAKPLSAYKTTYRFDAELSFTIFHLPVRNLSSRIFGSLYAVLDEHYYVVLDNYLVFSGSVESLKLLIQHVVLNKTIENDQAYKEFRNNLSPRSNLYFYCNLSKAQNIYSTYLADELSRHWTENLPVFQNIQVMGLQLFSSNNMLYSNFLLRHLSSYNGAAQTVWESKLDTLADFKPVFAMNHQTGQNEVFVQDLRNNIYLINQAGRILWKIQLPAPINSEIFQVDYFRNGKLQLLFSTAYEIYLVDRKGNFVEKYPVRLRSKATCGVSVFDYDSNREYRLFIACEDRHVYAYTRDGILLSGWEFGQSESEVTQPINHFRIGDRDFLVFGDLFKTYILDRKGNTRVNIDTYFPRSANNNYVLHVPSDGSGPSVVTTDTTGKVYFIGFNGQVKTVEMQDKYTNRHFFDLKDLNGDNKAEYIFLEGDRLTAYRTDLSKLFNSKFGGTVHSRPQYYRFSATDRKLGVVSRGENLIYLINNTGKLYEGFPLQGNTPFSIGNFGDSLSRFNLIVSSRDNFLYNYRVK